jgi:hypothetical protein
MTENDQSDQKRLTPEELRERVRRSIEKYLRDQMTEKAKRKGRKWYKK